ncbi:hypothetical protein ABZ070_13890 [Streptomyces sp. NPDC006283]|uniref:hypothetical protein n=1 Tax=Streptomyces sp. NPDC006283 TaxID=3156741 RepID=UPI0033A2D32C
MAPSATADDGPVVNTLAHELSGNVEYMYGDGDGRVCKPTQRDVSSVIVDYSQGLGEAMIRATTDRRGNAFLNDFRNPGAWIDLDLVPGAPECTEDLAVTATQTDPGTLFITLVAGDGVIHRARCAISSGTPLTSGNIGSACAPGFTPIPGTPV